MLVYNNYRKATIHYFNNWSSSYDKGLWGLYFRACYKKVLATVKEHIKSGDKILDLGCGTGDLAIKISYLLDNNGEVIGLDISQGMIGIANHKKTKYTIKDNKLKFIVGDSNNLPFPDEYFDLIFCLNSFHHYLDQKKTIGEIIRVLKTGGVFIILDPFLDNVLRRFWGKILVHLFKEPYAIYHTRESLRTFFKNTKMILLRQNVFLYFILISVYKKLEK